MLAKQTQKKKALPFYVVDRNVAVYNIKSFRAAMEKQEGVFLELLSSYKIFNTKVNIAKVIKSSNKVPVFLSDLKEICSFWADFN